MPEENSSTETGGSEQEQQTGGGQTGGDTSTGDGQDTGMQAEVDKWKAMARKHESQAKANADAAKKLKEIEDADKSDLEKANSAATEAAKRAEEAELKALRLEVALDKAPDGMSMPQVRKLAKRLHGTTQEELEADADELFADFGGTDDGSDTDTTKKPPARKPAERLRGGGGGNDEPDPDPAEVIKKVPRL